MLLRAPTRQILLGRDSSPGILQVIDVSAENQGSTESRPTDYNDVTDISRTRA